MPSFFWFLLGLAFGIALTLMLAWVALHKMVH